MQLKCNFSSFHIRSSERQDKSHKFEDYKNWIILFCARGRAEKEVRDVSETENSTRSPCAKASQHFSRITRRAARQKSTQSSSYYQFLFILVKCSTLTSLARNVSERSKSRANNDINQHLKCKFSPFTKKCSFYVCGFLPNFLSFHFALFNSIRTGRPLRPFAIIYEYLKESDDITDRQDI